MFQYFKLTFLAPLHWHTYIYWHKALVLWTFVPYSTQEGFGIGCDFVQFGIPDLRIRRLREEVHLTDLHIMPHVDPSKPPWVVGVRAKFQWISPPFPPTISTFPSVWGWWSHIRLPATELEGQFSGNMLPCSCPKSWHCHNCGWAFGSHQPIFKKTKSTKNILTWVESPFFW